jgi:hypothetical protein
MEERTDAEAAAKHQDAVKILKRIISAEASSSSFNILRRVFGKNKTNALSSIIVPGEEPETWDLRSEPNHQHPNRTQPEMFWASTRRTVHRVSSQKLVRLPRHFDIGGRGSSGRTTTRRTCAMHGQEATRHGARLRQHPRPVTTSDTINL